MILEPLNIEHGPAPDHKDGRSKRVQYSETSWGVVWGLERDKILRKAAPLLEEQYVAQYKRWGFKDANCARAVGAEQERSDHEEAERRALEELRIIRERLQPVGKRTIAASRKRRTR